MTEQEKKEKLAALEKEWITLYRKRKRHQFYLDGINKRMEEVEKEIKKIEPLHQEQKGDRAK